MRADLEVDVTAPGESQVIAVLRASSDALIDTNVIALSGDDSLFASVASTRATLQPTYFLGFTSYSADVAGADAGSVVSVDFERVEETSAPSSSVVVPPDFDLAVNAQAASRTGDAIVLTWQPTSALPIGATVTGECILEYQSGPLADTGRLEIPAASLHDSQGAQTAPSCTITAKLARRTHGTLDPAFGLGGSITAIQERSVSLVSNP
jgi:hypothetical protein